MKDLGDRLRDGLLQTEDWEGATVAEILADLLLVWDSAEPEQP